MSGNIIRDNPVAITAVQPFWQHPEFTPDGFIGVGDAARVRAADKALNQGWDLNALLLADLEIPDDIDCGTGGDERDSVYFFLGKLPVCEFDDILAFHIPAGDIGCY